LAFAGFLFATAKLLPPQYRFTRSTCARSVFSVSNAVGGSPYSVNALSLIPARNGTDLCAAPAPEAVSDAGDTSAHTDPLRLLASGLRGRRRIQTMRDTGEDFGPN
jgi:hypothetical protein